MLTVKPMKFGDLVDGALSKAKNIVLGSILAPIGYALGNIVVYGSQLGNIGGALPADTRIYLAFVFFAGSFLIDFK
jgi:hypothetical protein